MNPFLIEPVYKRPKRKPAAKKKPAVKRKAPVRRPPARRRGGADVVYIEDYVSPYDPVGLWSARPKDILGPKTSGPKAPVAVAVAGEPPVAVAPTGTAVGSGGGGRGGVFSWVGNHSINLGKGLIGLASATAGVGAGPSRATAVVEPSAPPLPEATAETERRAASAKEKEERAASAKAKAAKAAELKALEDLEKGREPAVQQPVQPNGDAELDAYIARIQPILRSIKVPEKVTVAAYTKELRKLGLATSKALGEAASPKYVDDPATKSDPKRYNGAYVFPAVDALGGIFTVMALQHPEILEQMDAANVAKIRRAALGQPKGTGAKMDAGVKKTTALDNDAKYVASALDATEEDKQTIKELAERLEKVRDGKFGSAQQRRATRKPRVTRPRR